MHMPCTSAPVPRQAGLLAATLVAAAALLLSTACGTPLPADLGMRLTWPRPWKTESEGQDIWRPDLVSAAGDAAGEPFALRQAHVSLVAGGGSICRLLRAGKHVRMRTRPARPCTTSAGAPAHGRREPPRRYRACATRHV